MTSHHALKEVILVKLKLTEMKEKLLPGDAIGLYPPNPSHEVLLLIDRLKLNKDEIVHVNKSLTGIPTHLPESSCTILELFTYFFDIHSMPKRELLKVLAEFASDEKDKSELLSFCSLQDKSHYQREIELKNPSLLDLLNHYQSSFPPLQRLILVLPPVKKRWYSQTVFCQESEPTVEIAMTIVKENKIAPFLGQKEGLCSHWMKRLLVQHSILDAEHATEKPIVNLPIYIRPNQHFRPPEDLSIPIIMIGAGTGIGVFRGFCQHRSVRMSERRGGEKVSFEIEPSPKGPRARAVRVV